MSRPQQSKKPTKAQTALKDRILSEREKGNVVFWGLPGKLMGAKLDDIVRQPAEGLLYDLNRLEEISMTFISDPKWVNDFAVALTIRKLVEQRDTAERELTAERERGRRVRKETIEECAKECEHRAFLCHAHNEHGRGMERGMLDAAVYVRALSRAESAPAGGDE